MLRQYLHKLSAMIDALDQSARSILRLEIASLTRKHVGQPRGHSGTTPNRGNAQSVFSPSRRLSVSPFRSPLSLASVSCSAAAAKNCPYPILAPRLSPRTA